MNQTQKNRSTEYLLELPNEAVYMCVNVRCVLDLLELPNEAVYMCVLMYDVY
jgi:hypothetical protein